MIKYRLKYAKVDKMCYIGHLDLIHVFQRAVKRAGLPISFSHGFNPHQEMSFALPLPLGMASRGEYVDIELDIETEPADIMLRLNSCLPDGMEIICADRLEKGEKSAAALITAASYEITISGIRKEICDCIAGIMTSETLTVQKKTKSTLKDVDIRPSIHTISVDHDSGADRCVTEAVLSAGNNGYVKPQLLVDYILNQMNVRNESVKVKYTRLDLLMTRDNVLEPLLENPLTK